MLAVLTRTNLEFWRIDPYMGLVETVAVLPQPSFYHAHWSPDGAHIAFPTDRGTIQVWGIPSGS